MFPAAFNCVNLATCLTHFDCLFSARWLAWSSSPRVGTTGHPTVLWMQVTTTAAEVAAGRVALAPEANRGAAARARQAAEAAREPVVLAARVRAALARARAASLQLVAAEVAGALVLVLAMVAARARPTRVWTTRG
jgi:hypothetical protein